MKYLLLLLLLLPNISIHSLGQDKYPKAQKGILDLRTYDLEKKKLSNWTENGNLYMMIGFYLSNSIESHKSLIL